MPFQLNDLFAKFRLAYHLTARTNLGRIRRTKQLESAAAMIHAANQLNLLSLRRRELHEIIVDGETIILRDQAPLHAGHIDFQNGWTFPQLIESLNSRVFFWPGDDGGPIAHGQRHFARYEDQGPAILRIPLADLIEANPDRPPLFCHFNSGSPRTVGGRKSPRGPRTFLPCDRFERNHRNVIEVTFEGIVALPMDKTEVRLKPGGAWQMLAAIQP
jgi:hypothetical protein